MNTKVLVQGLPVALFAVTLATAFAGCKSGNGNGGDSTAAPAYHELAKEEGPGQNDEVTFNPSEFEYGGKTYVVNIHRAPSHTQPQVTDSWGDPFLDNEVDVCILADGDTVMAHKFVKPDFASAAASVEGLDLSKMTLGGMNFMRFDRSGYAVLGGDICSPGDVEGGNAFKVKVSLVNGSFSISRDTSRENASGDLVE